MPALNEARSPLRILTTLDGSARAESALAFARALAAGAAEIIVLRVVPDQQTVFDASGLLVIPAEDDYSEQLERAEQESRTAVANIDSQQGVIWRVETRLGEPAEAILETIDAHEIEIVVMSSTGKGAFGRLTLGSVADRVSRTSPAPVLIVRAGNQAALARLIVPTDGSPLARTAIPPAIRVAARLDLSIEFIYVVDYSMVVPGGLGADALTPGIYSELLSETTAIGRSVIDQAVGEAAAGGVEATGKVLRGIPAQAIHDEAGSNDLIVMSSHGRSGISRWLIGSVAEKLVRMGDSPVMLVPARAPADPEAISVTI